MSVQTRLREWIKRMGYEEEIPESLHKICNPHTAFIWEQIISNVKPRQEVANVRMHIIAKRLKEKPLEKQHEFSYPIKEIQTYVRRQQLEKKIKFLEGNIEEKEAIADDLLKKNKMTYVAIDSIKQKIKESTEKKYLLEAKSKKIEEEINKGEEVVRNLTPVEMEVNPDGHEITETLNKCAEKLQKIAEGASFSSNISLTNPHRSLSKSKTTVLQTPRYSSKASNFSRYMNHSTTLTKMSMKQNNYFNIGNESYVEEKVVRNPKRESLGLLPNSYLNDCDEFDDVFLVTPSKIETSFVDPVQNSLFSHLKKTDCDILEKLFNEKCVKDVSKSLLYNNNRPFILKNFENIHEELLGEIRNSTLECNKLANARNVVDQDYLSELYFIHVKNELTKDKYRVILKKLQESVKKRHEEICTLLTTKSGTRADEMRRILELQIEEVQLDASINFFRKEIGSSKVTESSNELQLTSARTKQVKDDICQKIDCVQNLVENIYKILEKIRNNREETIQCVRSLNIYTLDLTWANRLRDVNSEEIATFKQFPIEYNRRFINGPRLPYRNVCESTIPSSVNLDSSNLEMVTMLMDIPFSTPESIILSMLQSQLKLKMLRSLQTSEVDIDLKKYTTDELLEREGYIESVINKLNSVINLSAVKQVLAAPSQMKEVADLWMEMPMRNYVYEGRLVEGHNYKYYENIFDSCYKKN